MEEEKPKGQSCMDKLYKSIPYILDLIIVIGTFLFGYLLFFKEIPNGNKDIMNIMFGTLVGLCVTVIGYHRGSSEGSTTKQNIIDKMSDNSKKDNK